MRSKKTFINKAFYQKLFLILSGTLVSLVVIELILRFTHLIPRMDGDAAREEILWQEQQVTLNSEGFRDTEFQAKTNFRVALLGDSIGFGWHVAQDKILAAQIEQTLPLEVVNLSKFGINFKDEVNIFTEFDHYLQPDLILVLINPNDIEISPLPSRGWTARIPFDPLDHRLNRWTYTYIFIKNRLDLIFEKLNLRHEYLSWNLNLYHPNSPQWHRFTTAFNQLDRARDNRPVVMVMFTGIKDFNQHSWQEQRLAIQQLAKKHNFYYLDLIPLFSQYDPKLLRASDSDGHPNATANALATQWVSDFLKENHLVTDKFGNE